MSKDIELNENLRKVLKENARRIEGLENGITFFTYITIIATIGMCFSYYMSIVANIATVIMFSLIIKLYSVDNRVLVWDPNGQKWVIIYRKYFSSYKNTLSSYYPNP